MKQLIPVLLLLLAAPAALADKISDAADAVVAAVKAGQADTLKALAADASPDPWHVADELCRRGAFDAAAAFAKAGAGAWTKRLPDYVASMRKRPRNTAGDEAFENGRRAMASRDPAAALEAVEAMKADAGDVVSIRAVTLRAAALRALRRLVKSEAAYLEAADAAGKIGWIDRQARSLHSAGYSAHRRGDHGRALDLIARETAVVRAAGNQRSVANLLSTTGLILIDMGRYDRATEVLGEALALSRKIDAPDATSRALTHLGIMHRRRGRLREALTAYEEVLALAEEAEDDRMIATALGNLGLVRGELGDPEAALAELRRSLAIYERLGKPEDVARTLGNIGLILKNMGDYDAALEAQEKTLDLYRKSGNRRGELRALGNLGVVHKRRGDLTKALEIQTEILGLATEHNDRSLTLGALQNLGIIYKNLAEYERALECYRTAGMLAIELGLRNDRAGNLLNRGLVHHSRGDFARALDLLERSLAIHREIEAMPGVAACLTNMGSVYRDLGDFERADAMMHESISFSVKQKDRSGEATALSVLAGSYAGRGMKERALELSRKVLEIRKSLGEQDKTALAHNSVGTACGDLGRHEEALRHLDRSLEIAEEIGSRHLRIQAHLCLGWEHLKSPGFGGARNHFARSVELAAGCGSQTQEAFGLAGLARISLADGRFEETIGQVDRAVALLDVLVTTLADEHGSYVRSQYALLFEVGTLAALARKSPPDIFRFLEAGRAGVLLHSLGGRDRLRAAVLPPNLLEEEARARSAESVARGRFQRALQAGRRSATRDRRKELDAARSRVKASIERIQREARRQADLLYSEPAGLETTRAALRPGEALVSYGLFRRDAVAIVVTAKEARTVSLATPDKIRAAVVDTSDPETDPSKAIAALRALVLDPLRLPSDTKRILVSPDGILSYVPFCLVAPGKEVAYIPSAATWALLAKDRETRGKGVLALADPTRPGDRLGSLPAARVEAKAIGDVLLIGKDATRTRLRQEIAKRSRWRAIHLACHGLVDPESPARAWLALAAEKGSSGDLTCLEVYRMSIPADLVVLSACETAKGKVYRSEGVVGFTRAFLFAGAPRVLVSLWPVNDRATKALMEKFYAAWRDGGVPAAAALVAAQRHVAAQPGWSHPVYWAAWQLWGLAD